MTWYSTNSLRAPLVKVRNEYDIFDSIATYAAVVVGNLHAVRDRHSWQPATAGSIVTLHGRFGILSLSGSFLPPPAPWAVRDHELDDIPGGGQVVGSMVGKLIVAGPVIVVAMSFTNIAYERLPLEEEGHIQMPAMAAPRLVGRTHFRIRLLGFVLQLSLGNMANRYSNTVQHPVDEWSGNSGPHPPFREKMQIKKKKDVSYFKLQCDLQ
ncbi:hypothetical protein NL676_019384 [Syzygium grande]|nr:hypothetical protein NL676_019384 [Syzygium grande]